MGGWSRNKDERAPEQTRERAISENDEGKTHHSYAASIRTHGDVGA